MCSSLFVLHRWPHRIKKQLFICAKRSPGSKEPQERVYRATHGDYAMGRERTSRFACERAGSKRRGTENPECGFGKKVKILNTFAFRIFCLRCPKKLILSAVLSFHFSVFSLFPFRFRTTHFAISDKRFQIFFYVSVFYSVFESCIFSAIDDRSLRDFPVSEFRVFQFFFVNQMPELLFRLFLAVLYFVNFTGRIRIIRNNHIEFADGKLKLKKLAFSDSQSLFRATRCLPSFYPLYRLKSVR